MVDASQITPKMEVLGSDGAHVGTVDHVDGDRLKLTRHDSADGHHHDVPLSQVARVDDGKLHLTVTASAALGAGSATAPAASSTGKHGEAPLPPVLNRAVDGAAPRRNFYLPWIVGIVGVILLLLLMRSCAADDDPAPVVEPTGVPAAAAPGNAALPVEAVSLPRGGTVNVEPNSLNYELQRYLASDQPAPRTFQFDKLNFDTGSAAIRPQDQANVDALAQILSAYPSARVRVAGYTDARGSSTSNASLGADRARAVKAALEAKGVPAARIEAATGGEGNPADTNATAQGQFENRRTELVVLAK